MSQIIFHQLFERETSSYTYLLGDPETREAIIIDPVVEMVERDVGLVKELDLKLKYVLDTHIHADHITGSGEIRRRTGAKVAISGVYNNSCADILLEDGQELEFGGRKVKALSTPGHTAGCMSFKVEDMVFTGDALLVRGCGRTDFQDGSSEKLFHSVRERLFDFPSVTTVFPAHDYKGFTKTSIEMEQKHNPRLSLSIDKEKFKEIMANLNLANPKKIHEAVPANLQCGLREKENIVNKGVKTGIPTITPEETHSKLGHLRVVDVRGLDEFNNQLGHIPEADLATLGEELEEKLKRYQDKDRDTVFVCGSGMRSAKATKLAMEKGLKNAYSLDGGMKRWNELHFPVERDMGGS